MITRFKVCLVVFASLVLVQPVYAGVVAVVSSKSAVGNLTKEQIADIYLGNTKNFPNGGPALPADLPEGANERGDFHKAITGKTSAQFKAYWAKMVFSGKGTPPKEIASVADLKALIAANPNVIGYLEKSAVDSSVKVVFEAN